jgi:hypothetical protein
MDWPSVTSYTFNLFAMSKKHYKQQYYYDVNGGMNQKAVDIIGDVPRIFRAWENLIRGLSYHNYIR